jgi:hypothetical protein
MATGHSIQVRAWGPLPLGLAGGRCRAGAIGTRGLPPAERRWPTRAWPDAAVGGQTRVGHHWPTAVGCLSAARPRPSAVGCRSPVARHQLSPAEHRSLDAVGRPPLPNVVGCLPSAGRRWPYVVGRLSLVARRRRAGTGRTPPARRRWLNAPGRPPPTACHGEGPPPAGDRPPRAARRRLPVGRMPPAVRRRRDAANQTSPTAGPPSERRLPSNPPKRLPRRNTVSRPPATRPLPFGKPRPSARHPHLTCALG